MIDKLRKDPTMLVAIIIAVMLISIHLGILYDLITPDKKYQPATSLSVMTVANKSNCRMEQIERKVKYNIIINNAELERIDVLCAQKESIQLRMEMK
jgi:hypothetical protein